jgi:hypothetical protein
MLKTDKLTGNTKFLLHMAGPERPAPDLSATEFQQL